MTDDGGNEPNMISRMRRRIGCVSAAAAALLSSYSVVESAQPIHRLLDVRTSTSIEADKRSVRPLIAPLVLKPSLGGAQIILAAGHRSHSSHSSHRSHTSGSFRVHSSHFSSSVAAPRNQSPKPAAAKSFSTKSRSTGSSIVAPIETDQPRTPSLTAAPQAEQTPSPVTPKPDQPIPREPSEDKPTPSPQADYNNLKQRFTAHTFSEIDGSPRATLVDHKEKQRKRVSVGDMYAGFKVLEIDHEKHTIELRSPDKQKLIVTGESKE